MKVIKLKLYQNLCNYKIGGSYGYVQTYPLPTPSMVKGMLHSVLNLKEFKPLKLSIQGESEGVITNIQRVYKFDRPREKNPYRVLIRDSLKTATHGIMFVDLHMHIKLVFHICFHDENLNNDLYNEIQKNLIVLGRNEDIARIDEIKLVEIKTSIDSRTIKTKMPMYVLPETLIERSGTIFRLPFYYKEINSFDENRCFNYIDVFYVGKDVPLRKEYVLQDEEEDIICWLGNVDGK